jgi:hypothetical protein
LASKVVSDYWPTVARNGPHFLVMTAKTKESSRSERVCRGVIFAFVVYCRNDAA